MKSIAYLLLLTSLFCGPALAANTETCNALLSGGVFDTTSTNTAWNNYRRISSFYCSDEANSYSKAKSLSLNAAIPIDDVLVTLGFGQSESGYNNFRNQLCFSKDQIFSSEGWLDQRISTASSNILSAYNTCVSTLNGGLTMEVQNLSRESPDFTWQFQNNIPSDVKVKVSVDIPPNIVCSDDKRNVIKKGATFYVTHSPRSLACTRKDCSSALLTVTKSSYGIVPSSIRLPGFNPPVPLPAPGSHSEQSGWMAMNHEYPEDMIIPNTTDDESCALQKKEGSWSCHHNDPVCTPLTCPDPSIFKNKYTLANFDEAGSYGDNTGNCRYTFICTKPAKIETAPPLPAYCPKI